MKKKRALLTNSRYFIIGILFLFGTLAIVGSGGTRYASKASPSIQTSTNEFFVAYISPICPAGCEAFSLTIENRTDKNIELDWNKTLYIESGRTSGGFMFEGVVYKDRNNPKPPDIVFANSRFSKIISPNNLVNFSSGRYGGWRHTYMPAGENGVYLTIKVGDKEVNEKLTVYLTAPPQ